MNNRHFAKYKSHIRLVMHSHKNAKRLLIMWSKWHPNMRKQMPSNVCDTVKRSIQITQKVLKENET